MPVLQGARCLLRPWRAGDEDSLQANADNYNVWRNLRDVFPYPYTLEDARWWIEHANAVDDLRLAIEVGGEAVGGIGCTAKPDVFRCTAEIGYWLGESYWGRGIVTDAVATVAPYVFETFDFVRLEAGVFARNAASARVLEKTGFVLEGRHRQAVCKDGRLLDMLMYARLR